MKRDENDVRQNSLRVHALLIQDQTMESSFDPKCDKCGAEITTGLMAAFCPLGEKCEFWPDTPEGVAFINRFRSTPETEVKS